MATEITDTRVVASEWHEPPSPPPAVIEALDVSRAFGEKQALDSVSFGVRAGEIHALLGPNGAGKTTLLRIFVGLLHQDSGTVLTAGFDPTENAKELRQRVGLVPAVDRTFYYRISGLENLAFFGRLYGFRRREAVARAKQAMEDVGLEDAMKVRVGFYSHGMQKRLGVARALLSDPAVLFVDEATHDLDPEGAQRVRELVSSLATQRGVAVVWTTQRIEEIRGFADRVTLLRRGTVIFSGTVPALMAHAEPNRFLVHVGDQDTGGSPSASTLRAALGAAGTVEPSPDGDAEHFVLVLARSAVLGDAITALTVAGITVLSCTEEQSKIEQAFMSLTTDAGAGAAR